MDRDYYLKKISDSFRYNPAVAILGPRQCGKTTLVKMYLQQLTNTKEIHYFDLEDQTDLQKLASPQLTLSELSGLIIIDEVQRLPELFPVLRVLIDDHSKKRNFLILGSASKILIKQSSETLAGRISYLELTPFNYDETEELNNLWLRGGFPKSYLAHSNEDSLGWRKDYIRTFLELDIPNLGFNIPPQAMRRFWMMLAHYHGGIFNASEIGKSLDLTGPTIRRYLDILVGTFMIRELQPWTENIKKRQVKSPKIYFRDSGILHSLLGVRTKQELLSNPKLGASWEGLAIESIISHLHADTEDCYFWAIHQQAKLDLLINKDNRKIRFEFKYTASPKLTKSMQAAIELLTLEKLYVVFPGNDNFPLAPNIRAVGLEYFLGNTSI